MAMALGKHEDGTYVPRESLSRNLTKNKAILLSFGDPGGGKGDGMDNWIDSFGAGDWMKRSVSRLPPSASQPFCPTAFTPSVGLHLNPNQVCCNLGNQMF